MAVSSPSVFVIARSADGRHSTSTRFDVANSSNRLVSAVNDARDVLLMMVPASTSGSIVTSKLTVVDSPGPSRPPTGTGSAPPASVPSWKRIACSTARYSP